MSIIATWRMSYDGVKKGLKVLNDTNNLEKALVEAVCDVEDNPLFCSVGYGGLPNINKEVELDASFMNGTNFNFGAVMGLKDIKNPIKVAFDLSLRVRNNVLAGIGAYEYAIKNKFETRDNLFYLSAEKYDKEIKEKIQIKQMEAYDGHDTVCVLGNDSANNFCGAVSTSGLFLKDRGRVGDSPIIGSGIFVDGKYGAAAATGVGEDIMRKCISYEIVRLMQEGLSAQNSCEKALENHIVRLTEAKRDVGSISVIALDKKKNFGVATNKKEFSFVYGTTADDAKVYLLKNEDNKSIIEIADEEWLRNYEKSLNKGSGY